MRAGDAGVVDEQVDARVALEDARRGRLDGLAVGDVARLVLVRRRRRPREADDERAPALQRLHELGADPGRGAGDDGYLQILIVRADAAVLPPASVSVATSMWLPFFDLAGLPREGVDRRPARSCRRRSRLPSSVNATWRDLLQRRRRSTTSCSRLRGAHARRAARATNGRAGDDRQLLLRERRVRVDRVADGVDVLRLLVVGGLEDQVRLPGLERRRRGRDAEQDEAAGRVVRRRADERVVVVDDERERVDARLRVDRDCGDQRPARP